MHNYLRVIAFLFGAFLLQCGEVSAQENKNPFDLNAIRKDSVGDKLPSEKSVLELEAKVRPLIDAGRCEEALPLLVSLSEQANRLSNLIRQGLEPFYDASRDEKKIVTRNTTFLNHLVAAESRANFFNKMRNAAWVAEAECSITLGNKEEAATKLYRALNFIDIDNRPLWDRARKSLWSLVGYE